MAFLEGDQLTPPELPADLERRVVLRLASDSNEGEPRRRAETFFRAQSGRWEALLGKNPGLSFQPCFSTLRRNADPRLLAYQVIICPAGVDPEPLRREVAAWPGVERAYVEPLPEPPPLNPSDDPRSANQGYLDAAPLGIDARWAWALADGSGMDVVDLERGWTLNHEDLSGAGITIISGLSQDFHGHGTAALDPGDVLLLEAQTSFNGFTNAPVEVEPAVFTAIHPCGQRCWNRGRGGCRERFD